MKNKRGLPSLSVSPVACVIVAACGGRTDDDASSGRAQGSGQSDAGGGERTPEQVQADIATEIDALNSCDSVEDCSAVPLPWQCDDGFINADADRTNLDALFVEYADVGGESRGCVNRCDVRQSEEEPGEGERPTCI